MKRFGGLVPADQSDRARQRVARNGAASTRWRSACRSRSRGRHAGQGVGRPQRRAMDRHRDGAEQDGQGLLAAAVRGLFNCDPGGVAAARPLPHPVGERAEPPAVGRGRLSAGPCQREARRRWPTASQPSSVTRCCWSGRSSEITQDGDGVVVRGDGVEVRAPARDRCDPAHPVRPSDVRTAAPRRPGAARPEHAGGIDPQGLGDV